MKSAIFLSLLLACYVAQAECTSSLPLKGVMAIENCDRTKKTCVNAEQALYEYMSTRKDDAPDELYIGLHGSPWHFYGPDSRVIEPGELADTVKQQGSAIKRVFLLSSWSGIAPAPGTKSSAQRLSAALGGMPVEGQKGFVWFAKNGAVDVTQQAFSVVRTGPYMVEAGGKVMASLAIGWPYEFEAQIIEKKDPIGLLHAGVGYDVFMLCPEHALKSFEAAAALGNPIAAYNAALLKLERAQPGDADAAIVLLNQAAAQGDEKAKAKLKSLSKTSH